jgi:hypothetical protein
MIPVRSGDYVCSTTTFDQKPGSKVGLKLHDEGGDSRELLVSCSAANDFRQRHARNGLQVPLGERHD